LWKRREDIRYSQSSRQAYQTLKNILKYHLFEKRDGGIINSMVKDNGEITIDPTEIDELLTKTMSEIQIDENWGWIAQKKFPQLQEISELDTQYIFRNISTNKAIAWDGASDIMFEKKKKGKVKVSNIEKTAKKLKDIWKTDLDQIPGIENIWEARMVPLNKVFPQNPTRTQLRPIMVQSVIVKAVEARFLNKLQDYLTYRLDRSQTGFVKNLGIQVNLTRALERITIRTKVGRPVYGVFIDFSNAYNSVPHTALFKKLREKNILLEEEICYLEQLYARYRIKIGKNKIKSNKGVAQGSMISPALFNIFLEDLSAELGEKASLNLEDRLFYADDVLLLTTSINQAKEVIQIVENWANKNGMTLNKKKSGIIIFVNRRAIKPPLMQKSKEKRGGIKWTPTQKTINGVPICDKYKYLGTWLDSKLTIDPQISHIRKKAAHIYVKPYPYLMSASADARRDIWQTMVAPLFNAAHILLEYEPSETHKIKLERIQRLTFKQFMMISKKTNTELTNDMMRKNLRKIAQAVVATSKRQWEERKKFQEITTLLPNLSRKNGMRGVPNSWSELVNTMVKPCPACKTKGVITSRCHLLDSHEIRLPHVNDIWKKEILPISEEIIEKIKYVQRMKIILTKPRERESIREALKPIIQKHLDDYYEAWASILTLERRQAKRYVSFHCIMYR